MLGCLIEVTTNKTLVKMTKRWLWPLNGGWTVCQEIIACHNIDNIEASLDDRCGLFFCNPSSFALIFCFITLPLEGLKRLQTSPVFHLPSPLLISDKSLNPIKTASIVQEGSSDFPFCNFKTAHDKATKITKYKCTHHFHHLGKMWFTQWRKLTFIMTFYCWTWEVTECFPGRPVPVPPRDVSIVGS